VAYPFTIREMMDTAANKRQEAQKKIEMREADVAAKFAKLDQWKKELNDRINKKTAEANAAKVCTLILMKNI
jgi:DNA-binding transcriptional MerR regulator